MGEDATRAETNPLRLLESRDPKTAEVARDAPGLAAELGDESRRHLDEVKNTIAAAGIRFAEDGALVRGLDYYNLTVLNGQWRMTTGGKTRFAAADDMTAWRNKSAAAHPCPVVVLRSGLIGLRICCSRRRRRVWIVLWRLLIAGLAKINLPTKWRNNAAILV